MGKHRRAHYAARIGDAICEVIATGGTLKDALASVPLAPEIRQFWRWYNEYPEFGQKFDNARKMQADIHADDMLEMARDAVRYPTRAAAYRVASDILKWQAEIRDPAKYGSKVTHELKAPPMKPDDLRNEITRLEAELGIDANTRSQAARGPASPEAAQPKTAQSNKVSTHEPKASGAEAREAAAPVNVPPEREKWHGPAHAMPGIFDVPEMPQ